MKKLFAFGILLLSVTSAYSQNCTGTHTLYCNPYLGKDKNTRKVEEAANWQSSTQSKSGAFVQGDTVNINIVVQKDQKYRITTCSANDELSGKIQMMILETETKVAYRVKKVQKPKIETESTTTTEESDVPLSSLTPEQADSLMATYNKPQAEPIIETVTEKERYYIKKEKILYNNADNNNEQSYIFTTDRTRKLTVRIITPVAGGGAKKAKGLGTETVSCVGVLIEHAKGPATGVNKAR